jgi:superfamily I DNA/RNA helicase
MARGNTPVEIVLRQVQAAVEAVDSELAYSLNSVLEGVQAFRKHDPDFTLEHLLVELSLGTPGGAPTEGGGVKLASLHRTKGLQWPHVYLVGMEEETLPDHRSVDDEEELRQERRLCFVGVCRAEERLTLTRVKALRGYMKAPSRFLREMKG